MMESFRWNSVANWADGCIYGVDGNSPSARDARERAEREQHQTSGLGLGLAGGAASVNTNTVNDTTYITPPDSQSSSPRDRDGQRLMSASLPNPVPQTRAHIHPG